MKMKYFGLKRGFKHGQFQSFLYQTLCVFSQIKDRKHIEQNFCSVAKVMARGGISGSGGVKNVAWGFAMAPHRLRALVFFIFCQSIFSKND